MFLHVALSNMAPMYRYQMQSVYCGGFPVAADLDVHLCTVSAGGLCLAVVSAQDSLHSRRVLVLVFLPCPAVTHIFNAISCIHYSSSYNAYREGTWRHLKTRILSRASPNVCSRTPPHLGPTSQAYRPRSLNRPVLYPHRRRQEGVTRSLLQDHIDSLRRSRTISAAYGIGGCIPARMSRFWCVQSILGILGICTNICLVGLHG